MLKLLILLAAVGTVIEGDLLDGYSCTEGSTKRVCKVVKCMKNSLERPQCEEVCEPCQMLKRKFACVRDCHDNHAESEKACLRKNCNKILKCNKKHCLKRLFCECAHCIQEFSEATEHDDCESTTKCLGHFHKILGNTGMCHRSHKHPKSHIEQAEEHGHHHDDHHDDDHHDDE